MTTRRDRLRAATVKEISETARRILVEEGADAVTLRAIARAMGMTAPALYRYFGSHGELLRHLVGDIFTELTEDLREAMHGVEGGDLSGKFLAVSRRFRLWAFAHPREYALLFGTPVRGTLYEEEDSDFAEECARKFGWTFMALFMELWRKRPFPVPSDDEIDPALYAQLVRYREEDLRVELPIGVIQQFLACWIRLQGSVSLEVFGHLDFALDDAAPMFELMLSEIAGVLGLTYTPPKGEG
ncbi:MULTISPECIES: TetR/AcrR family transcriptional regulator [Actinomadura]|uniref:TetR family transcriptional regulator n=1 Tax=Actinomadura litoris TaxID=2678616 RepID=A0A7K1L5N8_9ACTN|nr:MULTISPECIES: TetR/AcrR family transcriptional regulator [Actinomadura]MBT2208511.1 TetR/AcrR family transcriptional regulator [Actinomadura sp. NEAU-AAG7]MUN39741.1 TetR family transcriptional regulator [Actinomadura litoris]